MTKKIAHFKPYHKSLQRFKLIRQIELYQKRRTLCIHLYVFYARTINMFRTRKTNMNRLRIMTEHCPKNVLQIFKSIRQKVTTKMHLKLHFKRENVTRSANYPWFSNKKYFQNIVVFFDALRKKIWYASFVKSCLCFKGVW